ncbi:MAG: TMEM165/GDT1 family protein [Actinomycetota bacterium]|nr:TMEM165/GDT1 family protein [Actinomycetota bacterium]
MLKALAAAFGLTFVAEMGDKTQMAVLNLSARYGALPVLGGAAVAFAVLNALAVTVGSVIYAFIPQNTIRYAAAAAFLIFGVLSFRPKKEEEKRGEKSGRSPFFSSMLIIMLLEFADKTQLSLVALTAKYPSPIAVFAGGTAALWLASLIGALVGEGLGRAIPFKWVRIGSGILFIVFGILIATSIL